jgi:anthranilate phosphoribosyltransferase
MRAILAGEVTPAQAGAFLIAMRMKGEHPAELAGFAQALRDVRPPLAASPDGAPLVSSAGSFDGVGESPSLTLATAVAAAASGARVVVSCAGRLGPKYGTSPLDVLAALGGPARPSVDASLAMLERSGVGLVHAGEALPGFDRLAEIRDEIGLRSPVHSAEKLVDHFGARRFVIGHTHSTYTDKLAATMDLLGAERALIVRGIEGSDVLRPGRPGAFEGGERLDLPSTMGLVLRGEADPVISAEVTRAVLAGEERGVAARAVTLSAGVQLYAAGVAATPRAGVALAEAAIDDGRATATLERLLGG